MYESKIAEASNPNWKRRGNPPRIGSRVARFYHPNPDQSFAMSDGRRYTVNDAGELRRVSKGNGLTKKQRAKIKRDLKRQVRKVAA